MKNGRFRLPEPQKWMERFGTDLEIPVGSLPGGVHIELENNVCAVIDGCLGVLEYSDSVIRLNTGHLIVRLEGCDLTVVSMQNGQATVNGTLTRVEFTT